MWKILFIAAFVAGFQYFSVCWMHEKKCHVVSFCCSLAAAVLLMTAGAATGYGVLWPVAVLTAHAVFLLCERLYGSFLTAFPAVLFCLQADMLVLPIDMCVEDLWQWAVLAEAVGFCLLYVWMYNQSTEKRDEEWLEGLWQEQPRIYAALALMPATGCLIQGLILMENTAHSIFGTILTCVLFCIILAGSLLLQRLLYNNYILTQLNQTMEQWQKEARDYMNTIRSQRHDFNIHLHTIDGMIENGEYGECQSYVSEMVTEAAAVNDIMPVYDAMIGSMLYKMRQSARQKGTDIVFDIKYDMKHVICNAFECNKVIGNLIQNAIDAIDSDDARAYGIKVDIFKRRGNTVIKVSNLFEGDPEQLTRAFEPEYSTKKKHEGIGLAMVKRTLKKYSGTIYVEWKEPVVTFIVNIPNKFVVEK
jgi:hypothetical protein